MGDAALPMRLLFLLGLLLSITAVSFAENVAKGDAESADAIVPEVEDVGSDNKVPFIAELSQSELENRARHTFAVADTDGNGSLTSSEVSKHFGKDIKLPRAVTLRDTLRQASSARNHHRRILNLDQDEAVSELQDKTEAATTTKYTNPAWMKS